MGIAESFTSVHCSCVYGKPTCLTASLPQGSYWDIWEDPELPVQDAPPSLPISSQAVCVMNHCTGFCTSQLMDNSMIFVRNISSCDDENNAQTRRVDDRPFRRRHSLTQFSRPESDILFLTFPQQEQSFDETNHFTLKLISVTFGMPHSMTSPLLTGPTPSGVPVSTKSPGSSEKCSLIKLMR